jgi:hypothetical protein
MKVVLIETLCTKYKPPFEKNFYFVLQAPRGKSICFSKLKKGKKREKTKGKIMSNRQTRAALLPTPGDPFLLDLWIAFYKRWETYIDSLYVLVNSPADKSVIDYIENAFKSQSSKVHFMYVDRQIEHGEALQRMLSRVAENIVMLIITQLIKIVEKKDIISILSILKLFYKYYNFGYFCYNKL